VTGGVNPDLKRSSQAIIAWHYISKNRGLQMGVLNTTNRFGLVICHVIRKGLKFLKKKVFPRMREISQQKGKHPINFGVF
jgi:hypothetical protein